jgi:hypothetical protein
MLSSAHARGAVANLMDAPISEFVEKVEYVVTPFDPRIPIRKHPKLSLAIAFASGTILAVNSSRAPRYIKPLAKILFSAGLMVLEQRIANQQMSNEGDESWKQQWTNQSAMGLTQ